MVDDEPAVRAALQLGLKAHGFHPIVAATGQEAIELYQARRDAIDLVLLDVRMPVMTGPQIWEALRRLDPRVRGCFMSGDLGPYTADDLLQRGADRVLMKPFGFAELARTLNQVIDRHG